MTCVTLCDAGKEDEENVCVDCMQTEVVLSVSDLRRVTSQTRNCGEQGQLLYAASSQLHSVSHGAGPSAVPGGSTEPWVSGMLFVFQV